MSNKLYNEENTYTSDQRFNTPADLRSRFDDLKPLVDEKNKNVEVLLKSYHRTPWMTKDGPEPNWGQFQFKTDERVRYLSGISLDRNVWCRIESYESEVDQENKKISDQITESFHTHAIKPWHEKDELTFKSAFDSTIFSKGVVHWDSPFGCYPCSLNPEDVYPDTNATISAKSFDYVFIRKKYSLIQLYNKVAGDHADREAGKIEGWNKDAVLSLLSQDAENLKDTTPESLEASLRRGDIEQLNQDKQVNLLFCYVKEYKEDEEGNKVSLYVIPENYTSLPGRAQNDHSPAKTNFLCHKPKAYKCFSNVIAIRTSQLTEGYYSAPSFGEEIFHICKEYDRTTNKSIAAVGINSSIFLKVGSQKTKEKMQKIREGSIHMLDAEDTIESLKVPVDPRLMTEMMRQLMIDTDRYNNASMQGSEASRKGYPLTAREIEAQVQQLNASQSTETKIWVSRDHEMIAEIYRRFTDSSIMVEGCQGYEGHKRFKEQMERLKIEKKAYDFSNVVIFSRYNQFAGNASNRFQVAQSLVQATQMKPASPAEYRAKVELLSSILGDSNVSDYMDEPFKFDDEMVLIGQENQDLDDPGLNPANVPVLPNQNHVLHVEGHLQDYVEKLKVGNQMISQIAQFPQSARRSIMLWQAMNIVNSQDFKGAHIAAHLQQLQSDPTKKDEVQAFSQSLRQVQQQHDQLKQKIMQLDQQELQQLQQQQSDPMQDLEYRNKARMYELEEAHAETMNNIGLQKALQQTQTRQENSIRNQEIKEQNAQANNQLKQEAAASDIAAKQEKSRIDLDKERLKLATQARKSARKTATKQAQQPPTE